MAQAHTLTQSIMHRYLTLWRYQHRLGHHIRKHFDISGQQLAVLRHLLDSGPHSVHEISHFLYISDATTSPLLERMEQAGYVVRRRSVEDSRKVLVEPTERGRELAKRAPMGVIGRLRAQLPDLPLEELQAIDEALEKLSAVARVGEILDRKGSR